MNFVAALPPDECAQELQVFAQAHSSFTVRTRIKFRELRNGTYHFRIERSVYSLPTYRRYRGYNGRVVGRSNYIKLRVEGHLAKWADSGSTLVFGYARILPKTFIINGLFLLAFSLMILGLSVLYLADFFCLAPLLLFMMISFAHTTLFQPEALAERHKRALLKQIKRTLEGMPR